MDPSVEFLRHLLLAKDYHGLRTEAIRLTYRIEPPALHVESASPSLLYFQGRYFLGIALIGLGQLEDAQQILREIAHGNFTSPLGWMAELAVAESNLFADAPMVAASQFRLYLDNHPDAAWRARAAYLGAYAYATGGRFDDALELLIRSPEGQAAPVEVMRALNERPEWRRPGVAALLSALIPGVGQTYAGYPREGLSALLTNALLTGALVWSARADAWPTFGCVALFQLGYYGGNIYGAADAAVRHNRMIRDRILEVFQHQAGQWPPEVLIPEL